MRQLVPRAAITKVSSRLDIRTLLRILRKDTLFFDVPNPQVGCFVVLFTNSTTVVPAAKDIVFGFVRVDQLRDRDTLIERITPDDIEHIRIAGGDLFHSNIQLKVTTLPNTGKHFHADDMYLGLARQNAPSSKRPMPPIH